MCGRYATGDKPYEDYVAFLNGFTLHESVERALTNYNTAPTQQIAVGFVKDGARHAKTMRWGLIPSWAKGKADPRYNNINATMEKLKAGPVWRSAWKQGNRCVIPACGFYEWHVKDDGTKQPYYIQCKDQPIFGFAGIWDASTKEDGEVVESCTIITMPANSLMAAIHNNRERMPAILKPDHFDSWLHGDADAAFNVLHQYEADDMVVHPVGNAVNAARNNGSSLVVPV